MRTFAALTAAAAAAVLLLVPNPSGAAPTASAAPIEIGHIPECIEAVPAAVAVPGQAVNLDVRVLLDGVSSSRGASVMADAARSYSPLGITLVPSYQSVSFSGTEGQDIIDQAKATFGGARPAGSDVVLVLTSKDIEADGDPVLAGLADCIGGVAFPEHAFAVSEVFPDDGQPIGPLYVFDYKLSGKVAAHEVGHLMGAHHHYANCVEGIPSEAADGDVSPCTLMFNAVNPSSFNFSALNGTVVAGHAQAYAIP
jgi:hypothetical protein